MRSLSSRTDGAASAPLTARQIGRGLRLSILASTVGNAWGNIACGMPFTMLLEALEASGRLMGLATSLRYVPLMLQVPGSLLVESRPARKPIWAGLMIFQRSLWFAPALALLLGARNEIIVLLTVVIGAVSAGLDAITNPSWQGWMNDLVPEQRRGQFWSIRQFFCTISMLIAVLLGGIVMDRGAASGSVAGRNVAFGLVFLVAAVCGLSDILIHTFVPEPARARHAPGESVFSRIARPARDRNFRLFTLAFCAWNFGALLTCLNQVYLREAFGMTYTTMGVTMVIRSIGILGASLLLGRAIDRLGSRPFLVVMMTIAPVFPAIFWSLLTHGTIALPGLSSGMPQVTLLICTESFLSGITYTAVGLGQLTLIGNLAPEKDRSLTIAFFGTVTGVVAAVGALAGGFIADFFKAHPSGITLLPGTPFDYAQATIYIEVAFVWALAIPLMLKVRPKAEPSTVRHAFGNLLAVNPWRLTTGLYHLRQLDAAIAPREQASAVAHINAAAGGLAVSDLAKKLDDPDVDVREAAAETLGRLGTPEAVEALRAKLGDPETDLATCILRTLRHHPPASCVPEFLRFLATGTPDQRREAVRALGGAGDAAAIPALRGILAQRTDPILLSDTGTALARLHDSEAVFDILPRLRQTHSPVLRRSLAIAIANLLGKTDSFYRTLELEEQTEGSGIDRLLRDMAANFRRLCHRPAMERRLPLLLARIHRMETRLDGGDYALAAESAYDIARCFAAIARNAPSSDDASIEVLVWNNPRYAAGYWFLSQLRSPESGETPNRLETLLALQLLADWTESALCA